MRYKRRILGKAYGWGVRVPCGGNLPTMVYATTGEMVQMPLILLGLVPGTRHHPVVKKHHILRLVSDSNPFLIISGISDEEITSRADALLHARFRRFGRFS